MFQNPNTIWIEIIAILAIVAFLSIIIGIYVYKKTHHLPTGECACCHKSGKQLVKEYHKHCACKK